MHVFTITCVVAFLTTVGASKTIVIAIIKNKLTINSVCMVMFTAWSAAAPVNLLR